MEFSLGIRVIVFAWACAACGNVSHDVANTSVSGGGAGAGGRAGDVSGAASAGELRTGGGGAAAEPSRLSLCTHELTFGPPSAALGFEGTLDGETFTLDAWTPDGSEQPLNTAYVWLFRPFASHLEAVGFKFISERSERFAGDFWVGTDKCLHDGSWSEKDELFSGRVRGGFEASAVVERGGAIGTASGQVRLSFMSHDGSLVHELEGRFTLAAEVSAPANP